jgi:GNAT superfamily N-acetyltransferase
MDGEQVWRDDQTHVEVCMGTTNRLAVAASSIVAEVFDGRIPVNDWIGLLAKGEQPLCAVAPASEPQAAACLRVFDGRILVVDYIATLPHARGHGLASALLKAVRVLARDWGLDFVLLSTEDAAPFWVDRGLVLEQDTRLAASLNAFSDAFTLRDPLNTAGVVADSVSAALLAQFAGEGEGEDGVTESSEGEEDEMDTAIAASLALS